MLHAVPFGWRWLSHVLLATVDHHVGRLIVQKVGHREEGADLGPFERKENALGLFELLFRFFEVPCLSSWPVSSPEHEENGAQMARSYRRKPRSAHRILQIPEFRTGKTLVETSDSRQVEVEGLLVPFHCLRSSEPGGISWSHLILIYRKPLKQ